VGTCVTMMWTWLTAAPNAVVLWALEQIWTRADKGRLS
jgi:hypothetical protein